MHVDIVCVVLYLQKNTYLVLYFLTKGYNRYTSPRLHFRTNVIIKGSDAKITNAITERCVLKIKFNSYSLFYFKIYVFKKASGHYIIIILLSMTYNYTTTQLYSCPITCEKIFPYDQCFNGTLRYSMILADITITVRTIVIETHEFAHTHATVDSRASCMSKGGATKIAMYIQICYYITE